MYSIVNLCQRKHVECTGLLKKGGKNPGRVEQNQVKK